jgi:hypothetical protein
MQAMEFQEAENLCQHALAIHQECSEPGCLEEAADRQLLALVFSASGDHDKALENLVHASASLQANGLQVKPHIWGQFVLSFITLKLTGMLLYSFLTLQTCFCNCYTMHNLVGAGRGGGSAFKHWR